MTLQRTILLYESLSKKELKQLDYVIKNKHKKSLLKLHDILSAKQYLQFQDQKFSLFKALFSKKYRAEKDYLLRNEIRLYNQEIKKVIAAQALMNKSAELNKLYIEELAKRGLSELFQIELNRQLKLEEKYLNYEHSSDLYQLSIERKLKEIDYKVSFFEGIKEDILKEKAQLITACNDKLSVNVLRLAYVERVLFQLTQKLDKTNLDECVNLKDEIYCSNFANYNYLKAKSYQQNGIEKIETLKRIEQLFVNSNHPRIENENEHNVLLHSIATEWMLMGEYENALVYLEQCFSMIKNTNNFKYSSILLTYLSCLTKAGKHDKALEMMQKDLDCIAGSPIKDRIKPLACIIYILNKKFEEAEQLMPHNLKEGALDSYHYYRAIQTILHYENGLMELAYNESINTLKHLSSNNENNLKSIGIWKLLSEFIKVKFTNSKDKTKAKLQNLNNKMKNYALKQSQFDNDSLIMIWLRMQTDVIQEAS